ncbi:MAG: ArnT family glycosyltransferase [Rubrimonas sp.]
MVLFVLALTIWRLAMLALNRTDLFVDEAQYWFWSTDLALGYFSKPPLIAWIIRLSTEIGGDASAFWIRAPGPILHAGAALAVGAIGRRLYGPAVGALSGAAWATLPAVTAATQIISTDTVMLPFFAAALWLWLRLADRPSARDAVALGLALGLAFLGKYAAAYFLPCAALAALWRAELRIARRDAGIAGAVFAGLAGVNLGWNMANEGVTFAHTADNVGVADRFPDFVALAEFVGGQFAVMGPILFAGFLLALVRAPRRANAVGWCFAVPILLIVAVQALRAGANLNWAAPAFVAATPMATAWLADRAARLFKVSLGLHLAVAIVFPLMAAAPQLFILPNGTEVFKRLTGQEDMAARLAEEARLHGAGAIMSDNRAILAALTHHLRGDGLSVYAPRPRGMPANHYEMAIPLPDQPRLRTLWATPDTPAAAPSGFKDMIPVGEWREAGGFFAGRPLRLYLLEPEDAHANP